MGAGIIQELLLRYFNADGLAKMAKHFDPLGDSVHAFKIIIFFCLVKIL
jgi:hypothetical protein